MILARFQSVGRDLFSRGLISSSSGNLSIRLGERLIITRRGSALNHLEECDLIETGLSKNDRATPLASTELAVHRAIYQATSAQAIVHAHPPHAIALSLLTEEIVPNCMEGLVVLGKVPVLGRNTEIAPGKLSDEIAQALAQHKLVMVHGHGSFATGQLLEEALNYTTSLEESSHIICIMKAIGTVKT